MRCIALYLISLPVRTEMRRECLRNALPRVKERQLTCLKIGIPWARRVCTTRWKVGNLAAATRIEPDSCTDAAKITFRPPHVFVTAQITSFADPTDTPIRPRTANFLGPNFRTLFFFFFFFFPPNNRYLFSLVEKYFNFKFPVGKVESVDIGSNNFPSPEF